MFLKKNIYLIISLLIFAGQQGFSQYTQLSSIINDYTTIDSIYNFDDNDVDSLIVGSVASFNEGDTVMVYCVQGAAIATDTVFYEFGQDAQLPRNTGKYALVIVDSVDVPRNMVVLNTTIRNGVEGIEPMGDGEVAQLIRVPSYRNAEVTGTVTASPWDGATGGVVAMFVHGVLRLNGDIDVSGTGFRGAQEVDDYPTGDCSSENPPLYDSAFYHISNIRAGIKGEGTTDTRFSHMRGRASNINGGGGGNAKFSGGGGGSNFTGGGNGGDEASQCAPGVTSPGGRGGFDLSRAGWYYINGNNFDRGDRIFLGGGGGTGTRLTGRTTTDGGDGGGLVVIVADTIEGNGNWIIADGADVSANATGAGGGGGGGGGIILDVSGYKTTLNLSAVGGKGGDTNHPSDTTGPGGGGGGGIYWLAGTEHPGVNPDLFTNGASGEYIGGTPINYGAQDGGLADQKDDLIAPLRGFIFNSVPSEFTVCSDQVPDPIQASLPRGGLGPGTYTYQWVDSSATQNFWDIAPGVSNQQHYTFPDKLADTTYFRRIVTSGILPPDTSFRIAIYVHPAITNNLVTAPDTVCQGNAPLPFAPSATIGGGPTGGTYTYKWQKDEGSGYGDAGGTITGEGYQAPGLDISTTFARIAYSGVCVDTSNALFVQVWEPLTGNDITPYDTICYDTQPDQIGGPIPGAGDPNDKRYQWESALLETGPWTDVAGETGQYYQSAELTQTTWFRRVVYSGNDDACIDTSAAVEILNIPLITGNSITADQTVCTFDQAALLTGSDPGGGVPDQYNYRWQSRTESTGWSPAAGTNDMKTGYDPGVMDGDTTYYVRIVGSGGAARNVCLDTSVSVAINVLPPISNNVITTADPVKCQWDLADFITQDPTGGPTPGGGATQGGNDPTRIYQWETASGTGTPGAWSVIAGADAMDYTDQPQLDTEEDRWFRRMIFSGPNEVCKDTTAPLQITVHTQITGNGIEPFDSVCFADTKLLLGSTPSGEPALAPVFTWRDIDTGSDIPGSDQEQFTTAPYTSLGSYHYERIVAIGACTDTSNTMQITVMQLPGGLLTDNAFRACEKDTVLAIDLNIDDLQTYVLPWEVYLDNGVDAGEIGPIMMTGDGGLGITLDIDNDSTQQSYTISNIIYRSAEGRFTCESPGDSISGTVPVHVFRRPEPQILVDGVARDSFKVCNTTISLVADADNGISTWGVDPDGTVFVTPGTGIDAYLVSIPNNPEAFGKYTVTFTSEAGDCFGEDIIDLHYFEQPAAAFAGEDTMIFLINTIALKADPPTAGIGTWELVSGSGIIADEHDPNTQAYELGLGEENTFRWTVTNGEDEGTCTTSSDVTIVLRNEVKRYDGFSPNGDMDNEYYIMQGLKYADEFTVTFFNALGSTVRTITNENVEELEVDPSLIQNGLREDEMVIWDGRANNGNLVPSGTYYYAVDFILHQRDRDTDAIVRTDSYDFKGYVVVVRE